MFVHLFASQFCVRCLFGLSELQFVHRGGLRLWLFFVLFVGVCCCCVVFLCIVCCCGCSEVRMMCIILFHVLCSCLSVSFSLSSVCAIVWAVSLLCFVWFVYVLFRVLVVALMLFIIWSLYDVSCCCCSLMFSIVVLFSCSSVLSIFMQSCAMFVMQCLNFL